MATKHERQTNEGNGQTAEARKIPPCRVMDKYRNAQKQRQRQTYERKRQFFRGKNETILHIILS